MKRAAFLQAVLILLLLGVSWILLLHKINSEKTGPEKPDRSSKEEVLPVEKPGSSGDVPVQIEPDRTIEPVPGRWQEWYRYLETMDNPQSMRMALDQLRELIESMPPEEALDWILEFINSGADFRTGLAFQPGKNGSLRGAGSLRAILLDLLHNLDPALAAELAQQELSSLGTRLVPDVYVIHMRNYAMNPSMETEETVPFLTEAMDILMNYDPWIENPTSAIAEAMDFIVYTEDVGPVSRLSGLMESEQPPMLRHASALTLERLVDRAPLETLGILLEELPENGEISTARAGYFARLDPALPVASSLLEDYLKSPSLERNEAVRFIESFPNLNTSLSYNLVSTNISNTNPGDYVDRLENCLQQVQAWQSDPELSDLREELVQAESRILAQLTGQPVP